MAGIDNITGRILQEAQGEVDKILENAVNQAQEIVDKAGLEAQAVSRAAAARSEQQTKLYAARVKSSAESTRKKALLSAKQEIIDSVIDQAYNKLINQDDASYFDMMQKILAKAVRPEKGTIALPAADLARVPDSFKKAIQPEFSQQSLHLRRNRQRSTAVSFSHTAVSRRTVRFALFLQLTEIRFRTRSARSCSLKEY